MKLYIITIISLYITQFNHNCKKSIEILESIIRLVLINIVIINSS